MMKCPICGAALIPGADRCPDCGCHVRADAVFPEEGTQKHKQRHWGRLIVTLLSTLAVLTVILLTATISFHVRTGSSAYREQELEVSVPVPEQSLTLPTSLPESREDCFAIADGAVTFLPECWDGGAVLHVPETVDGQTVTALAPGCFSGCTELTTIVLPDSICEIGEEAFAGCIRMRGLYLPEGTVAVGADAFAGCLELEAIFIPSSVNSIAEGCFTDCARLLYIFYEGSFDDWNELYNGYVTPFTAAICLDGTYYHGTGR